MQICELSQCTGCFACRNICPTGAISIQYDQYGNTIPGVEGKKCISCKACVHVCPVNNELPFYRSEKSYAVWSKLEEDLHLSSSGGAAAVFSRYVLEKGGKVFGSASINGCIKHISIEEPEDLELLRGSKYVQSDTGLCYSEVKEALRDEQRVLFFGTPCQIAGLKNFIGKEEENLFTVDLICHGTPPAKYLQEHLAAQNVTNWDTVTFRGKYDYNLTAFYKKQIVYQSNRDYDLYFSAFSDSLTCRENCYRCRYARPERVSDITIGDFWGIDRNKLMHSYSGKISLVLPNTKKGQSFFQECQDAFIWEERAFDEAANPLQGNLLHASIPHPDRGRFLKEYSIYGFDKAVQRTAIGKKIKKKQLSDKIKDMFLYRVLRKVKRAILR